MRRVSIVGAACLFSASIGLAIGQTMSFGKPPEGWLHEIRFDESMGNKRPTPTIPKGWRFVSVSNGEKRNSNNLWFQDRAGNIYLVRGFNTDDQFILQDNVFKLAAGH